MFTRGDEQEAVQTEAGGDAQIVLLVKYSVYRQEDRQLYGRIIQSHKSLIRIYMLNCSDQVYIYYFSNMCYQITCYIVQFPRKKKVIRWMILNYMMFRILAINEI